MKWELSQARLKLEISKEVFDLQRTTQQNLSIEVRLAEQNSDVTLINLSGSMPFSDHFKGVVHHHKRFRLHGFASSMDSVNYSFDAVFVIRQIARIFHESVSYCKCNVWDIYEEQIIL